MPPDLSDWFLPFLACAVVALVYFGTRTQWPIRITLNETGVVEHCGLPQARAGRIIHSLNKDFKFDGKITVFGVRHPNGHLETRIVGKIDPGTKQRLRNVLVSEL